MLKSPGIAWEIHEYLNKRRDTSGLWAGKFNSFKIPILSKVGYKSNLTQEKNLRSHLHIIWQADLKIYVEIQRTVNNENINQSWNSFLFLILSKVFAPSIGMIVEKALFVVILFLW